MSKDHESQNKRCGRNRLLALLCGLTSILTWASLEGVAHATVRIDRVVNDCAQNTLSFTRTSPVDAAAKYELYRADGGTASFSRIKTLNGLQSDVLIDYNFLPGTFGRHTYFIRATATNGRVFDSNQVSVNAGKCQAPSRMRVRVLRVKCPGSTILPTEIEQPLFDATAGAASVKNYFNEVSYGAFNFEPMAISDWSTIASKCGSSYRDDLPEDAPASEKGRWIGNYPSDFHTRVETAIMAANNDAIGRPDLWIVVANRASSSMNKNMTDGTRVVYIGGGHFNEGTWGAQDALHEIGHVLKLPHASTMGCTDTPFPASWDTDPDCWFSSDPERALGSDTDWTEPMGKGGWHYSALSRVLLGWIPSSDVQTVTLNRSSDFSQTFALRDAGVSSGTRLIQINYNARREYFFLEYRRALGFNAAGMLGDPNYPMSASVFIRYLPTRAVTCGDETACLRDATAPLTWIPNNMEHSLIRMDQDPYWDPFRQIRITMVSRSGRETMVKIEHEAE